MNKLIIALIAGAFAATAGAQAMKSPEATKEKQAIVQDATKGGGDNTATGAAAAKGSAAAKMEKGTPKALPTKAEKAAAAAEATKTNTEGAMSTGAASAKGAAMAKSEKGSPKALKTKKEKQEAVDAAAKASKGN